MAMTDRPRAKLNPAQLRTVADRRYGDAIALKDTQLNERANGAIYLAGFVIELLLKAALIKAHPYVWSTRNGHRLSADVRELQRLCYSHELDEIAAHVPDVRWRIERRGGHRLWDAFRSICATWTIMLRYTPMSATRQEAVKFIENVREIKKCLS